MHSIDSHQGDSCGGDENSFQPARSNIVGLGCDEHPLVPCPLHFSALGIEQQERDERLRAQGLASGIKMLFRSRGQ